MQSPTNTNTYTILDQNIIRANDTTTKSTRRHILNTHLYTIFTQSNQNLIKQPNSIHKEIYNFVKENSQNINLNTLTNKFPFLPEAQLKKTLKYKELINEYSHPYKYLIDPHHIFKILDQQVTTHTSPHEMPHL